MASILLLYTLQAKKLSNPLLFFCCFFFQELRLLIVVWNELLVTGHNSTAKSIETTNLHHLFLTTAIVL